MDFGLAGKRALITGGSSGIGLGIARILVSEGVKVAVASRDPDIAAIDALSNGDIKVLSIKANVSSEEQVIRMIREAESGLGGLDFYINNAAWTWHQPVTGITSEALISTINTNLFACVYACREAMKLFVAQGHGGILIIGSTARFTLAYNETAYRISKTGLKTLCENLAVEAAPYGIRVNMITPGHFKTRMTSGINAADEEKLKRAILLHRFGHPEEIGRAAAFLLSDVMSSYTTGADIVVDGGLSLQPFTFLTEDEIYALNR